MLSCWSLIYWNLRKIKGNKNANYSNWKYWKNYRYSYIQKYNAWKDISKETEAVLKNLDVFNPEVLITVSTNLVIVILTARVLAAESGNLDQFKIEFIDDNGNKFYQHLDDRGNLVGDDECWKITYQKDLIFRLVSNFYKDKK